MCENENTESKVEDVKAMHSQHARILKEDDEIWISSEDLNTENSTDEDRSQTKHAHKKKLKLKNRKRSSPNIKLQRPSIPSVPSTSSYLDDRLLMPVTDDANSRSTDESKTSDEEYMPNLSSDRLAKRLSLEDWRPMRGSLKTSHLKESVSTPGTNGRKIVDESGNFYSAMLDKLKSLKSCSLRQSDQKEEIIVDDKLPVAEKTFKYLKNTPDVKRTLDVINKLDKEINETICRYKSEREDRLQTEFEMCENLTEQKLNQEKDISSKFLQMCNFQNISNRYQTNNNEIGMEYTSEHEQMIDENSSEKDQTYLPGECSNEEPERNKFAGYFIRKNIYAAKEGAMASFSLTDEEKTKIADLLKDIDNFEMEDAELVLSTDSLPTNSENTPTEDAVNDDTSRNITLMNAFSLHGFDKTRLDQIDVELEKITEDQASQENISKVVPVIKDEEFWKKYALDKYLKEIDAKLEKLHESYEEDERKLKLNLTNVEYPAIRALESFKICDN